MDYIKFQYKNEILWGIPRSKEVIDVINGNPVDGGKFSGRALPMEAIEYLPPVERVGKIVCVGWNYLKHTREDDKLPDHPALFLKAPSALRGHRRPLLVPPEVTSPKYEAEIAVVMGKRAKRIEPDQVGEHILGWTCANDFTAKEVLDEERIFARAKGYDTFAPVGPVLKTDYDYRGKTLKTFVNGELWQSGTTDEIIFTPEILISYISRIMTLEPWDIVFTGTPRNSKVVKIGDRIVVDIEALGRLETEVVAEKVE